MKHIFEAWISCLLEELGDEALRFAVRVDVGGIDGVNAEVPSGFHDLERWFFFKDPGLIDDEDVMDETRYQNVQPIWMIQSSSPRAVEKMMGAMGHIKRNVVLTIGTETLRPAFPRARYSTVVDIVRMKKKIGFF